MSLPIDSVYFLVFPGWRTEMQGSNWHYARRWARQVPVVIVEPELAAGTPPRCEPEPRLENVEILSVREQVTYPSFGVGLIEAEQILGFMRRRNHRRPLLWLYNPCLAFAYALLPAAGRIYHLVEDYFDFPPEYGLAPDFIDMMRAAIAVSDKVLCFSRPAIEHFRAETGREDLEYLPIGCDYSVYANPKPAMGGWPDKLQPLLVAGTPIAVYGGNIDMKLDFPLLHRLAEALGDVHFVYVGPVNEAEFRAADGADWVALLARPNVTHLGRIDIGDVPWLYRLADRGFIPYRSIPFYRKSAFPLKALEMAATGLPVVASLMEPLLAVPGAVEVAADDDAFIEKLRRASRRSRSAEEAARAAAVCRAYDYDHLFERVLAVVLNGRIGDPPRPASLAPVYEHVPLDRAVRDLAATEVHTAEMARLNEVYTAEIDRLNEVYPAEIARLNEVYTAEIDRLDVALAETRIWRRLKRAASVLRVVAGHPANWGALAQAAVKGSINRGLLIQLVRVLAAGRASRQVVVVPKLSDGTLFLCARLRDDLSRLESGAASPGDVIAALEGRRIRRCMLVIDPAVAAHTPLISYKEYELPDLLLWLTARPARAVGLICSPRRPRESASRSQSGRGPAATTSFDAR
jgi:glycosyltransferase involved in cell wall biosynthesis